MPRYDPKRGEESYVDSSTPSRGWSSPLFRITKSKVPKYSLSAINDKKDYDYCIHELAKTQNDAELYAKENDDTYK